jgi:hypothetical protein
LLNSHRAVERNQMRGVHDIFLPAPRVSRRPRREKPAAVVPVARASNAPSRHQG